MNKPRKTKTVKLQTPHHSVNVTYNYNQDEIDNGVIKIFPSGAIAVFSNKSDAECFLRFQSNQCLDGSPEYSISLCTESLPHLLQFGKDYVGQRDWKDED